MKISLILAHPKSGSFNHVIAEMAKETLKSCGHQVAFHDLYGERFDPRCLKSDRTSRRAASSAFVQKETTQESLYFDLSQPVVGSALSKCTVLREGCEKER
jgi:putative NADPH-quinone reductase